MLAEFTNDIIFQYAVIFARLGSVFLFMPGIGESYVTSRSRLAIGLTVSLIFFPLLKDITPPMPETIIEMFLILLGEVTVGIFIGLMMRVIQSTLHIAGMKIAFMSGLSTATLFDANQSTQGSVIGGFLSVIGITLFFTTNLHHIFFQSFYESYQVMAPASMPLLNSFSLKVIGYLSASFLIAFKISAPVITCGLMLYLGAGLMGRLMRVDFIVIFYKQT